MEARIPVEVSVSFQENQSHQVKFHADRIREVSIRVLKSITLDPRITPEEQLGLLTEIAGVHVELAEMIHSAVEHGCHQAVEALQKQGCEVPASLERFL